jgi:colanic acid biosynthesis glycosyl transferase WcaI
VNASAKSQVNQPRKILIVCQHFWPESFRINDIADFLAHDKDCDVEVLCGLPNYPSGRFSDGYGYFKNRVQTHNGIKIRRAFEIPRGNNSNIRIFLNYVSFPVASLFHIPRLLTKRFDKILIYQLSPVMMSVAGIIVGKLTRTETTMYVLDLWPENLYSVLEIKNSIIRKVAESVSHWHYRHVDKLVALSEAMKVKLIATTGVSPDKIIVLPQACEKIYEDDVYDKELAKRFEGGFNAVFTGNISPAQSFDTIVSAAKSLKAEGLDNIRWIIVGDGMSRKGLEHEVKKSGLAGSFHFEGFHPVEDMPKFTGIADVLIGCLVKSDLLEATIPAKVMSYIASGKPMVLSMDGEVKTLINDTIQCGFVGETENADELAANIWRIYNLSSKDRSQMGKRARNYHFRHFERNLILNKLYAFMFS